jgi:predicted nucleic acid-binding protein
MTVYLLDTNACIALSNGTSKDVLPTGAYDVLLAGQARRRGATLVTSNVGEFDRVAGLKWEDWTVSRR